MISTFINSANKIEIIPIYYYSVSKLKAIRMETKGFQDVRETKSHSETQTESRPVCKFGSQCYRQDCWYSHPDGKTTQMPTCRFGHLCRNRRTCKFTHAEDSTSHPTIDHRHMPARIEFPQMVSVKHGFPTSSLATSMCAHPMLGQYRMQDLPTKNVSSQYASNTDQFPSADQDTLADQDDDDSIFSWQPEMHMIGIDLINSELPMSVVEMSQTMYHRCA
jgi:hypothetical protein